MLGDLSVRWSTLVVDIATLGTAGSTVALIWRLKPFRRGFFCGDESIAFPLEPNPTFNSRAILVVCFFISFSTAPHLGGIILLIFVTVVTPTRRGIYCDDESIQYPFHKSTIPNYLLYIYGFTIPLVLIIVTEICVNRRRHGKGVFLSLNAPNWILAIYRSLVDFAFGMAATQLITDIGKYSIGRLRPNFISVCRPDIDFANCQRYNHSYIMDYKCMESPTDAQESRVSFPSGHSSFSAYTMLYCAIFIQAKWRTGDSGTLRILKHAIQLILVLLAYFTAVSRVMDNKHHWSDVTAGGLIGAILACLTAKYVGKLGKRRGGSGRIHEEETFEGITINNDEEERRTPKGQAVTRPLNGSNASRRTQDSYVLSPFTAHQ